jgi:hypothetical protein
MNMQPSEIVEREIRIPIGTVGRAARSAWEQGAADNVATELGIYTL